jgi:glucose/arabinose dehydrogenase
MHREFLRTASLLLLLGGTSVALAQQPSPPADAQQQSQQEKAQQTQSGKTGTVEPSAHAPTDKPAANAVFVNGALAVPDAPANSQTVPAKFSAQNAADDKLVTLAYTFKALSDEQRRAIYQALKDRPAGQAFNADIGVELPSAVELHPMPAEVANRVPQTRHYRYAVADNRVLLVAPINRVVVGVFPDAKAIEAGEGRRTP